jgi:zinc protease
MKREMSMKNRSITKVLVTIFALGIGLCLQGHPGYGMPPVKRSVLANGLVLLVSEEHSLPLVTIELLIDAGSRRDPAGKEGLAYLTAQGLLLGTKKHSEVEINEKLDYIGASLAVSVGRDYTSLRLRVLKKDLTEGLELFLETITEPSLPEEKFHREVRETEAAIQSSEERPEVVAEKAFRKKLFLDSPYSHPVEGTRESLGRIKREDVVKFHSAYYSPNISIFTIVGDVTVKEVEDSIVPKLSAWHHASVAAEHFSTTFAGGPETVEIDRDISQANIIIGHQGIRRENPDFYALTVMNYILGGGGFGSRLVDEIRVDRGLAYSVASFFGAGKYQGSFQIILQTKNASAREAISLAIEQMKLMQRELVSKQELERAKKYLTGSFPLRLDTQRELVDFLSRMEYYGLGLDYPERYRSLINSVGREEVLRVARVYLYPKKFILTVVANLKEAGMAGPEGAASD